MPACRPAPSAKPTCGRFATPCLPAARPSNGTGCAARLRVFLQWAVEEDLIEANPVLAVRPAAERSRDGVLSAAEIRIVWKACEAFPAGIGVGRSFSRAVRFILLTALREGEAGNIRYRDVIDGRLTIPDTKGGKSALASPATARARAARAGRAERARFSRYRTASC